MVELLTIEKRRLLAEHGRVTRQDFEEAWERSWELMRVEHAYPHATPHRRGWRKAMNASRGEYRAAFLDRRSGFGLVAAQITGAALRGHLSPTPVEMAKAVLAATAYAAHGPVYASGAIDEILALEGTDEAAWGDEDPSEPATFAPRVAVPLAS